MPISILLTKLYISSPRPEVVSRPHLIERLNAGLVRQLSLISSPAGFGKTTLLQEWVSAADLPVAWLSLDTGDNDPNHFWSYVIAALQTVKDDLGRAVFEALGTPQPPPLESLIIDLINDITDNLGIRDIPVAAPVSEVKTILILDDFHLITAPEIHETLTYFFENLPPQLHLIISSRVDPPWPLARFRAQRKMTEIRTEDLRFTTEEVAAFTPGWLPERDAPGWADYRAGKFHT